MVIRIHLFESTREYFNLPRISTLVRGGMYCVDALSSFSKICGFCYLYTPKKEAPSRRYRLHLQKRNMFLIMQIDQIQLFNSIHGINDFGHDMFSSSCQTTDCRKLIKPSVSFSWWQQLDIFCNWSSQQIWKICFHLLRSCYTVDLSTCSWLR